MPRGTAIGPPAPRLADSDTEEVSVAQSRCHHLPPPVGPRQADGARSNPKAPGSSGIRLTVFTSEQSSASVACSRRERAVRRRRSGALAWQTRGLPSYELEA